MGFGDLIESIALATLYFTINTAPNSPFNVAPNTSFYIAINIAQHMTANICANITSYIAFNSARDISVYIALDAALNVSLYVTPHIGVDLQDSKLSIDKSKRHELINFFNFRHYL